MTAFERFKEKLNETEKKLEISYKLFSDFEGAFERRMLNSAWHSDGILAKITFANGKVVLIKKTGQLKGKIMNSFGEVVQEVSDLCMDPVENIRNDKDLIKILEPDDDAECFMEPSEFPVVYAYIEGTSGDINVPLESKNIATAVLQIEKIKEAFPELDDPAPDSISVETLLEETGATGPMPKKEEPKENGFVPVQKEPEKPKKTERKKRVKKTQQLAPFGVVIDFLNAKDAVKKEKEENPNVSAFDMLARFSGSGEYLDLIYAARLFAENHCDDPNAAVSCLFCGENMDITAEEVVPLVNRAGEAYVPIFSGIEKRKTGKDRDKIVFDLLTAARIVQQYPAEVKEILGIQKGEAC